MNEVISGYCIICSVSDYHVDLSHDWGTEFYHEEDEAKVRAEELNETIDGANFMVMPATLTVKNMRNIVKIF